jgi:hypothetical protein
MMPEELLHCSSLQQDFPKHIWASHVSGRLVGFTGKVVGQTRPASILWFGQRSKLLLSAPARFGKKCFSMSSTTSVRAAVGLERVLCIAAHGICNGSI